MTIRIAIANVNTDDPVVFLRSIRFFQFKNTQLGLAKQKTILEIFPLPEKISADSARCNRLPSIVDVDERQYSCLRSQLKTLEQGGGEMNLPLLHSQTQFANTNENILFDMAGLLGSGMHGVCE